MRFEVFIEKHRVSEFARLRLKRQRDKVAKSTRGQDILIRKKPVIRGKRHRRVKRGCLRHDESAKSPRHQRRHRFAEEDPCMPAVARTRTLDGDINFHFPRGVPISKDILLPALAIEVRREKHAGVVLADRISADHASCPSDDLSPPLHPVTEMPDACTRNISPAAFRRPRETIRCGTPESSPSSRFSYFPTTSDKHPPCSGIGRGMTRLSPEGSNPRQVPASTFASTTGLVLFRHRSLPPRIQLTKFGVDLRRFVSHDGKNVLFPRTD